MEALYCWYRERRWRDLLFFRADKPRPPILCRNSRAPLSYRYIQKPGLLRVFDFSSSRLCSEKLQKDKICQSNGRLLRTILVIKRTTKSSQRKPFRTPFHCDRYDKICHSNGKLLITTGVIKRTKKSSKRTLWNPFTTVDLHCDRLRNMRLCRWQKMSFVRQII